MRFYTQEDVALYDSVEFLFIKTAISAHIFTITLNRPDKRNAFTPTMAEEITFALAFAHYNAKIRCVIINAEGSVFCAGADLNAFHDPSADQKNPTLPAIRKAVRLGDAFADLLKPSIACVQGAVLAGGFLIICGCTFVFSVPNATFGLPEVKRGIWPMQVMASLTPIVAPRKILEMCITGNNYSAEQALQLGLVTNIAENANIEEDVKQFAGEICNNAPLAIQKGIQALQQLSEIPGEQKHAFLKKQLDEILKSEDAKEGIQAFREKRAPEWKGR